jgi:hypothetical protein
MDEHIAAIQREIKRIQTSFSKIVDNATLQAAYAEMTSKHRELGHLLVERDKLRRPSIYQTEETTKEVFLRPCPHCGKELTRGSRKINPYAKCETEGCWGQKGPVVPLDVPNYVVAWNRRADDDVAWIGDQ